MIPHAINRVQCFWGLFLFKFGGVFSAAEIGITRYKFLLLARKSKFIKAFDEKKPKHIGQVCLRDTFNLQGRYA